MHSSMDHNEHERRLVNKHPEVNSGMLRHQQLVVVW